MSKKPTYEELEKKIQELKKAACEYQPTELELKRRLEFEQLIAKISSELAGTGSEHIDSKINNGLASIGAFTMADRAYIFEFKDSINRVYNTYEWCANRIEPQIENLKDIPIDEELPWFAKQIRSQRVFHVPEVAALPHEADIERKHFEEQNIQSLIVVPMETADRLIGFLGFDAVKKCRAWGDDDITLLKFFGQTISHVLERKKAEEKLQASESRYRLHFESINEVIYSIDRDFKVIDVSPSVEKTLGYKPEELIGKPFQELNIFAPEYLEKAFSHILRVWEGEKISSVVYKFFASDGTTKWGEVSGAPIYTDGKVVATISVARDITERIQIEKALNRERDFLSVVFDNIEEAIVICDADGKLIRFNDAARKLHGVMEQPVKSNRWAEYYDLYKTDGSTPLPVQDIPLFMALDGEHVQNVEIIVAPKNSKSHFLVCNGQALRNDAGEVIGAVIAMHDITKRKKTEENLRAQTKTLNDILEKAADGICVCYNIPEEPYVRFTHWNPRMTEITGYTKEEINQVGWYQSMYPDPEIQQKAIERMTSMRQADDIKSEEWIITRKDKKQKALSISTSVIKQENGKMHVLALMQDID